MQTEKCAAYFKRLGLSLPDPLIPDSALLQKIQYAHCTKIPYENLDILRSVPLDLDYDSLFDKIVTRGRGGYCFELNGLLGWLLRELGYQVTDYMARYLRGESTIPMRRHRVLKVVATDGTWICDVGIGEVAPRLPIRLEEHTVQEQYGETYRLTKDPFLGWVLEDLHHGKWRNFYAFTEEPQLNVDFIAPSFYCEKNPDSPFTSQEMFSLKTAEGRITLDGNVFKRFSDGSVEARELQTAAEMQEAYRQFGLEK